MPAPVRSPATARPPTAPAPELPASSGGSLRPGHLSTQQYARIVKAWVKAIGLDPAMYGTHTMRRTKASLIYRRTKNLRAVHLLLGHTKLQQSLQSGCWMHRVVP
ncbi:hypothetical protein IPC443_29930 [Pseudomonas aeruginosa]|nr:hypothetical protein IPC443_29930 [Pseudomonas aeruginosa]